MVPLYALPEETLSSLSESSRASIERLWHHQAEEVDLTNYPYGRLAAVLVLLYESAGELRVLLTTRDKSLRSHPGQVALPGGKVDITDADIIETAYREAHEEVGLPRHCPHVHTVCTLRPYISSAKLFVTPIVAVLTELSILERLAPCPGEVDRIFDHPLEAILDPSLAGKEKLAEPGSEDWIYSAEYHNTSDVNLQWLANSTYRMHRFRSTAFAIKGLTSDILIATAEIAYNKSPTYERYAPGQLKTFASILRILEGQVAVQYEYASSGTSTPVEVGVASGLPQATP